VLLVQVTQGHRVGQELIQVVNAGVACALIQGNGVFSRQAKSLRFVILRRQDGMVAGGNLGAVDRSSFHVRHLSDGKSPSV
jgi:hypothetical protein